MKSDGQDLGSTPLKTPRVDRMRVHPFHDVLHRVPRLAGECIQTLNEPGISGLYQLREVSKSMRTVMVNYVRRCTLWLDGIGADMFPMMMALKGARFTRLTVIIVPGKSTGLCGWEAHETQLTAFMSVMTPAFQNVTHLKVVSKQCDENVDMTLHQLAVGCPAVTELWLYGRIRLDVMREFAGACAALDTLKVSRGSTFDRYPDLKLFLDTELPALRRLEIVRLSEVDSSPCSALYGPLYKRLLSATLLTNICASALVLSDKAWEALPKGLKHLECTLEAPLSEGASSLPCLESLKAHSINDKVHVNLLTVTSVVRQSPALSSIALEIPSTRGGDLGACYLHTRCTERYRSALVHLESRVSAGLDVVGHHGLYLLLVYGAFRRSDEDDDRLTESESLAQFVSGISDPLPYVRRLCLDSVSITNQECMPDTFLIKFPDVDAIEIRVKREFNDLDMHMLGKFKSLEFLRLGIMGPYEYDLVQISLTCQSMKSLKFICLYRQDELTDEQTLAMQTRLRNWGIDVRVEAYD